MTEATIESFGDGAITNMCGKKNNAAKVAGIVQSRNESCFGHRIGGAWASLINERNQLRILDLEDGGTRVKDMPTKPENFLSFTQQAMNQCCWAAKRYIRAQQENADTEALQGITGIDFSQDVAEQLGIEPMDISSVEEALMEDFTILSKLHSVMSLKMSYLPSIEDFHLYADREQEGEVWRVTATADTFEEALALMDEVVVKMREREDKTLMQDMTTMDFTS